MSDEIYKKSKVYHEGIKKHKQLPLRFLRGEIKSWAGLPFLQPEY